MDTGIVVVMMVVVVVRFLGPAEVVLVKVEQARVTLLSLLHFRGVNLVTEYDILRPPICLHFYSHR